MIFELNNTFDDEHNKCSFIVHCSKGTYIRAIARDIGDILKCGGYLTKLIRTQQGCFNIEEAKNHWDVRGAYSAEIGRALAFQKDKHVLQTIHAK